MLSCRLATSRSSCLPSCSSSALIIIRCSLFLHSASSYCSLTNFSCTRTFSILSFSILLINSFDWLSSMKREEGSSVPSTVCLMGPSLSVIVCTHSMGSDTPVCWRNLVAYSFIKVKARRVRMACMASTYKAGTRSRDLSARSPISASSISMTSWSDRAVCLRAQVRPSSIRSCMPRAHSLCLAHSRFCSSCVWITRCSDNTASCALQEMLLRSCETMFSSIASMLASFSFSSTAILTSFKLANVRSTM
mmetsp:Transcript_6730/g.9133  ORF Transcript_6730/g.9133 Transcript_6730/m.9133 type:complete len:249 (+) Transcript_6730:1272-2018(+)